MAGGEISLVGALLLGTLQGIFEWLPISSSGQLALLLSGILGLDTLQAYRLSIASHLGTALSGAVLAREELLDAARLGPWLRVVAVPLVAGAPIGLAVDRLLAGVPGDGINMIIGILLAITAVIVWGAKNTGHREATSLTTAELVLVGVAQGLAALPGLSRSATTIAVLLTLRLSPVEAVRASIAMGTVATAAAGLYQLAAHPHILPLPQTTAMLAASLATGLLSGTLMISLARRYNKQIAGFTAIIAALAILSALPAIQ